ncbi:MAG: hypothetical protein ACFFD2_20070 [Promethearchaeota archaeon]
MVDQEPGIVVNELPDALPEGDEEKAKQRMADILTLGIIFGFIILIFALTIVIIDLIPGENKLDNFLTYATWGNWVLAIGAVLLGGFLVATASIFIWRKGRKYLKERI